MKREFLKTGDGSYTIHLPDWNEQYHSKHGALNEALHVFINHGLRYRLSQQTVPKPLHILEIGFGTGLNAFLTYIQTQDLNIHIDYTGVEAFPVEPHEISRLNYHELTKKPQSTFMQFHEGSWETRVQIDDHFHLTRLKKTIESIDDEDIYDIVYFDAFGPRVQPELWTPEIFEAMYKAMKSNGVLVTYSAKGSVRRAMQTSGFDVERLPGPPGKREMLRATKT